MNNKFDNLIDDVDTLLAEIDELVCNYEKDTGDDLNSTDLDTKLDAVKDFLIDQKN